MLKSLQEFVLGQLSSSEGEQQRSHTLELATAALLLEISRSDSEIQEQELQLIREQLEEKFNLDNDEILALMARAGTEVDDSVSLYEFTRPLNENLSREERVSIVELLWQVAFADGVLDKYEEFYVRKIADLLYVSQKDYIRAKHRADN
ncbi:MAG: TerB family tellurite resistance protein [Thiotrichales bacterium]|nr:TerB family tellurite resistance protein [Thiotrichales bacterium]